MKGFHPVYNTVDHLLQALARIILDEVMILMNTSIRKRWNKWRNLALYLKRK
jgi:hypothetical protein